MPSATCCMTTLVSFPSRHRVKHIPLVTNQRRLRTINDHRNFVVDSLNLVINTSHSIVDASYPVVDASHFVIDADYPAADIEHRIIDHPHSIIDSMRGPQDLRSCHPNLLVC